MPFSPAPLPRGLARAVVATRSPARPLRSSLTVLALAASAVAGALACGPAPSANGPPLDLAGDQQVLRGPEAFAGIADPAQRSRALFGEASKVLFHPRCLNCHPAGDSPAQGDAGELHDPPVFRGDDDRGVPGLRCDGCHQDRNLAQARVPGAAGWHLAPLSMAWQGRGTGAVCEQLKDPARNGGKTLAQIVEHAGHDPLVAWGWAPGHGRVPAPGSQERFAALMQAWMDAGAACPPAGKP